MVEVVGGTRRHGTRGLFKGVPYIVYSHAVVDERRELLHRPRYLAEGFLEDGRRYRSARLGGAAGGPLEDLVLRGPYLKNIYMLARTHTQQKMGGKRSKALRQNDRTRHSFRDENRPRLWTFFMLGWKLPPGLLHMGKKHRTGCKHERSALALKACQQNLTEGRKRALTPPPPPPRKKMAIRKTVAAGELHQRANSRE